MKLSIAEVAEILMLSDGGMSDEELAERFDVHKTTIAKLRQGKIKKGLEARKLIQERVEATKLWEFSRLPRTERLFYFILDKYKRKYFAEKLDRLLEKFEKLYPVNNHWKTPIDKLEREAREVRELLLLYKDAVIKYGFVSKSTIEDYINILTLESNEQTDAIERALYNLAYAISELYKVNKDVIFGLKEFCGSSSACENAIGVVKEFTTFLQGEEKYLGIKGEKFINKAHINVYEVLRNGRIVASHKERFFYYVNERIEGVKERYAWATRDKSMGRFYTPEKISEKYREVVEKLERIYEDLENALNKK